MFGQSLTMWSTLYLYLYLYFICSSAQQMAAQSCQTVFHFEEKTNFGARLFANIWFASLFVKCCVCCILVCFFLSFFLFSCCIVAESLTHCHLLWREEKFVCSRQIGNNIGLCFSSATMQTDKTFYLQMRKREIDRIENKNVSKAMIYQWSSNTACNEIKVFADWLSTNQIQDFYMHSVNCIFQSYFF